MHGAVLLDPKRNWECPSCGRQIVTQDSRTEPRLHPCHALNGVLAPFVEVTGLELNKNSVRLKVTEREDYIGTEIVTCDASGRPVMNVITERADGSTDCHAFAGHASITAHT